MLLSLILIVISLAMLIFGAEWLVKGASSLAAKLGVSTLVIGLTVVAFGTSAPELTVSLSAALKGSVDIAIGNIIGSNIANILLILGVSGLVATLKVKSSTVYKEIPLMLGGSVLLLVLANDVLLDGGGANILSRTDGMALLAIFGIFIYYVFSLAKKDKHLASSEEGVASHSIPRSLLLLGVGLGLLIFGGRLLVQNAVIVAQTAGLSEAFIGLTIVAIGTSLPELATSVIAVRRGQTDIAIGNVVGSNIFNIFWILGLSSLITPLPVAAGASADFLVAIVAALLLFIAMFLWGKKRLTRYESLILLILYVAYMAFLVIRG